MLIAHRLQCSLWQFRWAAPQFVGERGAPFRIDQTSAERQLGSEKMGVGLRPFPKAAGFLLQQALLQLVGIASRCGLVDSAHTK